MSKAVATSRCFGNVAHVFFTKTNEAFARISSLFYSGRDIVLDPKDYELLIPLPLEVPDQLEGVFAFLNHQPVEEYTDYEEVLSSLPRSMSVGDLILVEKEDHTWKLFACDLAGWKTLTDPYLLNGLQNQIQNWRKLKHNGQAPQE